MLGAIFELGDVIQTMNKTRSLPSEELMLPSEILTNNRRQYERKTEEPKVKVIAT